MHRLCALGIVILLAACNAAEGETPKPAGTNPEVKNPRLETPSDGPLYAYNDSDALPEVFDPFHGDLPELLERRIIRAAVPWSDTYYYLDGPKQSGLAYELLEIFEKQINEEFGSGTLKVFVIILPVHRNQLLDMVVQGRADIALGGITITDERSEILDFSDPMSNAINELVIEASDADSLAGIDDLSGRKVHLRKGSSYWESLESLNREFENRGLAPVQLTAVDGHLATEDLMQLADAGAIEYTIADSETAAFWANALTDVRVRQDIAIREGARYGWAFRKDSPELKSLINRFVKSNRQGTLTGNVIINRYANASRLQSIKSSEYTKRLEAVMEYFQKYSQEHEFDALMMVAQGFQESRLDQSMRSHRGAIGVMQLLPSTASDPAVGVEDIYTAENNILAGIRYMAWIRDTYFDDSSMDELNRTSMAFASYNAGPSRVRGLRKKAEARGLDPNVWFDNVEIIAAEEIGRETVDYVANIQMYRLSFALSMGLTDQP